MAEDYEIIEDQSIHRKYVLALYVLLVVILTIGGILLNTGVIRPFMHKIGSFGRILIFIPFGFFTWPAKVFSLIFAGFGAGANANPPVSFFTIASFVIWSCIFWFPLLTIRWRKIPLAIGIIAQTLFIIIIFALFWRFGLG